jgi:hypothetical protein
MYITSPSHLILIDFPTQTVFGKKYNHEDHQ